MTERLGDVSVTPFWVKFDEPTHFGLLRLETIRASRMLLDYHKHSRKVKRASPKFLDRRKSVLELLLFERTGSPELSTVIVVALIAIPLIIASVFSVQLLLEQSQEKVDTSAISGNDASASSNQVMDVYGFLPQALFVVVAGSITAGFAWAVREQLRTVRQRTRIRIIEELSFGKPLTRQEIAAMLRQRDLFCRIFWDAYFDALESLMAEKLVLLRNGKYQIAGALEAPSHDRT